MIKKIGILTSGGDSPGMNAAIRSIVINSLKNNYKIYGFFYGYLGLFKNKVKSLKYKDINNIIDKSGTLLGSSRFIKLKKYKIKKKIIKKIKNKIDILIIIGGEGSYKGALKLNNMGLPCITIPGTIDNDIPGTDYTIGFSSALETIVKYIDNVKYTLLSHKRILILEVMGRKCCDLALYSYISSENCYLITYKNFNIKNLIKKIKKSKKKYLIIIITENITNIKKLSIKIQKKTNIETRFTSIGYIQRSGKPTAFDRILAFKMGNYAIKLIKKNKTGKCIAIKKNKIIHYDIKNIIKI